MPTPRFELNFPVPLPDQTITVTVDRGPREWRGPLAGAIAGIALTAALFIGALKPDYSCHKYDGGGFTCHPR